MLWAKRVFNKQIEKMGMNKKIHKHNIMDNQEEKTNKYEENIPNSRCIAPCLE